MQNPKENLPPAAVKNIQPLGPVRKWRKGHQAVAAAEPVQNSTDLETTKVPASHDLAGGRREASVAWWLGRWTCNPDVPCSNPAPCH